MQRPPKTLPRKRERAGIWRSSNGAGTRLRAASALFGRLDFYIGRPAGNVPGVYPGGLHHLCAREQRMGGMPPLCARGEVPCTSCLLLVWMSVGCVLRVSLRALCLELLRVCVRERVAKNGADANDDGVAVPGIPKLRRRTG